MSMDKETARKVARLARIRMSDQELEAIAPQMSGILKWVEQLAEVNTDNVAPLSSVVENERNEREDEETDGGDSSKVLSNAPEKTQGYYVVSKVVE